MVLDELRNQSLTLTVWSNLSLCCESIQINSDIRASFSFKSLLIWSPHVRLMDVGWSSVETLTEFQIDPAAAHIRKQRRTTRRLFEFNSPSHDGKLLFMHDMQKKKQLCNF